MKSCKADESSRSAMVPHQHGDDLRPRHIPIPDYNTYVGEMVGRYPSTPTSSITPSSRFAPRIKPTPAMSPIITNVTHRHIDSFPSTPSLLDDREANILDKDKAHVPSNVYLRATLRYARDRNFADMMEDWNDFEPSLALRDIRDAIHDCPPIELLGPQAGANEIKRFVYRTLTFRGNWINHPAVPLARSHTAAVCQIIQCVCIEGKASLRGLAHVTAISFPSPDCEDAPGLSSVANVLRRTIVELGGPTYPPKKSRIDSGVGESESSGESRDFSEIDRLLEEACAVPLPVNKRKESMVSLEGLAGALSGLPPVKAIRHKRAQSETNNGSTTTGPSMWAMLRPKTSGEKTRSHGKLKQDRSASEHADTAPTLPLLFFDRDNSWTTADESQSEAAEDY